tara:strand:- start:7787 stop:8218 length:432 start_codon:yes stop_codon:yes gene_type:complete
MALLPGGNVIPFAFTAAVAILKGSPVYRDAAGSITHSSVTDDAASQALDSFGIFIGTATGGDAAIGDTDCQVAIGGCEVRCSGTVTPGDLVMAAFSGTAGECTVELESSHVLGDTIIGMAITEGAAGGMVGVDVRPYKLEVSS